MTTWTGKVALLNGKYWCEWTLPAIVASSAHHAANRAVQAAERARPKGSRITAVRIELHALQNVAGPEDEP
jgi:hypothetical protein